MTYDPLYSLHDNQTIVRRDGWFPVTLNASLVYKPSEVRDFALLIVALLNAHANGSIVLPEIVK